MWAMPLTESQLIAIEEHGFYQGLLGAGQAGGNTQNSLLMGSRREIGGRFHNFEVYYFHISLYVCATIFNSSF